MKAVILNGAPEDDTDLRAVYNVLVEELTVREWEVHPFILHDMRIAYCRGCFDCWIKTPGLCIIDDASRDVTRGIAQSDLTLYLTPIVCGTYGSELKKAVDRTIPLLSPFFKRIEGEIHHRQRYEKRAPLIVLGMLPEPDERSAELFRTLVQRNAINMQVPAHVTEILVRGIDGETIRSRVRALLDRKEARP